MHVILKTITWTKTLKGGGFGLTKTMLHDNFELLLSGCMFWAMSSIWNNIVSFALSPELEERVSIFTTAKAIKLWELCLVDPLIIAAKVTFKIAKSFNLCTLMASPPMMAPWTDALMLIIGFQFSSCRRFSRCPTHCCIFRAIFRHLRSYIWLLLKFDHFIGPKELQKLCSLETSLRLYIRAKPMSPFLSPGKLIGLSYSPITAVQGSLSTAKKKN